MYDNELNILADAAVNKYTKAKNTPVKYFMSCMIAGFYIVVATILAHVTAAMFYPVSHEVAKLLYAFLFAIAIILVIFISGDLFTGNNMTMAIGAYQGKTTWGNACRIWLYSYIGNFIGVFLLGGLFLLSGAARDILYDYYLETIPQRLELSSMQLLIRGILCNYLVCMAVFIGYKVKSESAKLVLMFCIIATFIMPGFEHSIANMATFMLSGFILGDLSPLALLKSFGWVTLGNIIGGAILFALPLKLASSKTNK